MYIFNLWLMLPHSHIQQMWFCCRISPRDTLWERTMMIREDHNDLSISVKAFYLHLYLSNTVNLSAHFFRSKWWNAAYYSIISPKFDPSLIWFLHIFPWRNTSRFILPHMCFIFFIICTKMWTSSQKCFGLSQKCFSCFHLWGSCISRDLAQRWPSARRFVVNFSTISD